MRRPTRWLLVTVGVLLLGLLTGAGLSGAGLLRDSATRPVHAVAATGPTAPSATPSAATSPDPASAPPTTPTTAPAPPTSAPAAPALWSMDSNGKQVRELEARLVELDLMPARWVDGHYGTSTRDGVARFQAGRRLPRTGAVDSTTWTRLKASTHRPTQAELFPVAAEQTKRMHVDERCLTGRVLCIDKTSRTLAWVINGKVQKTLAVRFGSEFTPTREGIFSIYRKDVDHVSTLFGSKMPYAMFFSGGQAVHYSSDFAARGYTGASHGCVNVRNRAGIRSLFEQVHIGDKVVVFRG